MTKPYWVDTGDMPSAEVHLPLREPACRARVEHYQNRVLPQTEHVWPDLFCVFARADWVIGPRLLKGHLSFVVISIALGAAVRYKLDCGELRYSSDLWDCGEYPGHSPEALRSALLTAHWLGVDIAHVENLGLDGPTRIEKR